MIRLGYVSQNTRLESSSKTFRLANYESGRMLETSRSNLEALKRILDWNLEYKIYVFRITSNLIPYGSSPVNNGSWKKRLIPLFQKIGRFIRDHQMRVSMHPGQYTVLNTPNKDYYQNALFDLEYHCEVLDLMQLDDTHKIIIHGGGRYQNKEESMRTLTSRINLLPGRIRSRLTLENDEIYTAEEIYNICATTRLPGVFDILHHQINPSFPSLSEREIIQKYAKTWEGARPEIHYSNQEHGKVRGAHSETIDLEKFKKFFMEISDLDLDIVLEVKDKQESVLKLRKNIPQLR